VRFSFEITEKEFNVGKHLEIEMEFKTSELNGILLSVSESTGTPSLSIEISDGVVSNETTHEMCL
jgi:laminin alpha 1/2